MSDPICITHSGHTFVSLGTGKHGYQIWPIKEFLVRSSHTAAVAERIERLNPNGKEEGEAPRGWHPKKWHRNKRALKRTAPNGR